MIVLTRMRAANLLLRAATGLMDLRLYRTADAFREAAIWVWPLKPPSH
jgi:hypothetical protein